MSYPNFAEHRLLSTAFRKSNGRSYSRFHFSLFTHDPHQLLRAWACALLLLLYQVSMFLGTNHLDVGCGLQLDNNTRMTLHTTCSFEHLSSYTLRA